MLRTSTKVSIGAIILCGIVALTMFAFDVLRSVDNRLQEARFAANMRDATGSVVFLAIDKQSLDSVGQWPWPRRIHGKLIDRLQEAGASAIAFDIDFSTPSNVEDDRLLADALKRAGGSVVLAAFRQPESIHGSDPLGVVSQPISQLLEQAWAASVNVIADEDGFVRRMPLGQWQDGELLPSLPAMLAGLAEPSSEPFGIDFSIRPETIPVVSVRDVLDGTADTNELKGKIVLVGASALELRDTLPVPVSRLLSGPALQILATETLLQDRVIEEASGGAAALLTALVLCFVLVLVLKRSAPWRKFAACIGASVVLELSAFGVQTSAGIALPTAPAHAALFLTGLCLLGLELWFRQIRLRMSYATTRDLRQIFGQVVNDNFDAILVCDRHGKITLQSEAAADVLGIGEKSKTRGSDIAAVLPAAIANRTRSMLRALAAGDRPEPQNGTILFERDIGDMAQIDYVLTPTHLEPTFYDRVANRESGGAICFTARDVTAEQSQKAELEYLARHDALTGALNRAEFVRRLTESPTYLCVIELLDMAVIEGTFGPDIADSLIVEAVKRIEEFAGPGSLVSRLSTHRLAVPLAKSNFDAEALGQSGDLVEIVANPYNAGEGIAKVRCIAGVAGPAEDVETQLRWAETALAMVEVGSTQPCVIYDQASGRQRVRKLEIERRIWRAMDEGHFKLVFQPQIDLAMDTVAGGEALVRWEDPELGKVFPDEFIGVAERNGAIRKLGLWILEEACRRASMWDVHQTVSVNVSAVQLADEFFFEDLRGVLMRTGLTANRLVLELTESVLLSDRDQTVGQLEKIRELGVSIALDDFGTGYSSLQYLTNLPIDILKVDRSFVVDLDRDPKAAAVLRSVLALARSLGLHVCCEGIETQAHAVFVAGAGCDTAQGYHYARPMSPNEFEKYCCAWRAKESRKHVVNAAVS